MGDLGQVTCPIWASSVKWVDLISTAHRIYVKVTLEVLYYPSAYRDFPHGSETGVAIHSQESK